MASRLLSKNKILKNRIISVVIPALNESASLPELFQRLDNVAAANNYKMQVVLVDDGSSDETEKVVSSIICKTIDSILYVKFRKNFGKSEALSEGVIQADGEVIITMDADLQDLPEEIPNLVKEIDSGVDVVSGWKASRKDPFFSKRLPSLVFNSLVRKVLGVQLKDINCGLKAYRKEVWDEIKIYGEFHRFIPALAAERGFTISEVMVEHHPRKLGVSKYGASRFIKGIFDLLTVYFLNKYQCRPLHFFGVLGGFFFTFGILGASYLTILWFSGESIGNRPLLMLSVLFIIIGVQVILFGLLSQLQLALHNRTFGSRSKTKIYRNEMK